MNDDEIAALLRRAGHKVTPQRLMIIRALREAGGHVSAAKIAEEVKARYPVVDLSTVYRTLDVLKRMHVATAIDVGTGDALFEWVPQEPHHHLVCTSCGAMTNLDHSFLEDLGARLHEQLGFRASLDHFAVFGLCRDCTLDGDETQDGVEIAIP